MKFDLNELRRRAGLAEASEWDNQTVLGPDSQEGEDAQNAEDARSDALYELQGSEEKKIANVLETLGYHSDQYTVNVTLHEGSRRESPTVEYEFQLNEEFTVDTISKMVESGIITKDTKLTGIDTLTVSFSNWFAAEETVFAQFIRR